VELMNVQHSALMDCLMLLDRLEPLWSKALGPVPIDLLRVELRVLYLLLHDHSSRLTPLELPTFQKRFHWLRKALHETDRLPGQ